MSEEEKKAIEYFEKYINDFERRIGKNLTTEFNEHLKVLLNQVENQQKEIEELKQNRDEYKEEYKKLLNARYYNYISKDKIREIIAEYQKQLKSADTERTAIMLSNFIMVLNDLLEEN